MFPLPSRGMEQKVFTYWGKMFDFKLYITKDLAQGDTYYTAGVDSIIISEKHTHKYIQTIVCDENSYICSPTDSPRFYLEDMNFDGYEDFRIAEFLPAGPNVPFYYWLYNNNTQRFEPNSALEEITSPQFDQKNKSITSHWRASATLNGVTTYKLINGTPEITDETDEEYSDEFTTITTKKRINGELKIVSQKQVNNEQ